MDKFVFNWVILLIYLFFVFYVSSLEKIEILDKAPEFKLRDKALHFFEYGILGFLTFNAFRQHEFLNKTIFFHTIMFSCIYAITDEAHQLFIPGRTFSLYDMFADFLGSSLILIRKLF